MTPTPLKDTQEMKDTKSSVCKHSKKYGYKVDKAFKVWITEHDKEVLVGYKKKLKKFIMENRYGYDDVFDLGSMSVDVLLKKLK